MKDKLVNMQKYHTGRIWNIDVNIANIYQADVYIVVGHVSDSVGHGKLSTETATQSD